MPKMKLVLISTRASSSDEGRLEMCINGQYSRKAESLSQFLSITSMPRFASSLLVFVYCATLLNALPAVDDRNATAPLLSTVAETASTISSSAAAAAPSPASSTASAPPEWETVTPASSDPNAPIFPVDDTNVANPEAMRGGLGSNILGPNNVPLAQENPDLLAPPTTDNGDV